MQYTAKYNELKSVFDDSVDEILIPGSDIRIANIRFSSDFKGDGFLNIQDVSFTENYSFSYPVFIPKIKKGAKTILLLHGLNERSWIKYLAWAFYLCEQTGNFVVLFPISFHINRSPESWKDPKAMYNFLIERKSRNTDLSMASFANIALSNRLSEDPMRFFNSGYQTVEDLVKLMSMIRDGKHEIIPGGSRINLFAYSIGAFLAEIIMMGNPNGLFDESKLFIFCGGSVFSNMHGTSKYIMDSMAYEKVFNFYLEEFEEKISNRYPLRDFIFSSRLGMAFRSMIDLGRFRKFREGILSSIKGQIKSVALVNDKVIPAAGIVKTLDYGSSMQGDKVIVTDFPFPYTHENPFPVLADELSAKVDSCFDYIFSQACLFLA
jgi:hypothetical protein